MDRDVDLQAFGDLLATHPKITSATQSIKMTNGIPDPVGQHLHNFWLKVWWAGLGTGG